MHASVQDILYGVKILNLFLKLVKTISFQYIPFTIIITYKIN